MKLKYYSEQTFPKVHGGAKSSTPKINFGKTGVISLNKAAIALIGLTHGDKVTIAQDENEKGNFYIFKDDKNGYPLRNKDFSKTGTLAFNHRGLQSEIAKACDADPNESQNFLIAGQATTINGDKTKYWGLLLKSSINVRYRKK